MDPRFLSVLWFDLTSQGAQVALSVWHDEARGISRHQEPPGELIDVDEVSTDEEAGPSSSRKISEPPTRPPSSASERTSGPDRDFDTEGVSGAKSTGIQGGVDEFDFEVEMWDDSPFTGALGSTSGTSPQRPSTKPPVLSLNQDDDQDMWDLADELHEGVKPNEGVNPSQGPPTPVDDDCDSMYA